MSCGVGCRLGSDPTLLWFWRGPGATAPIRPLAWEPPYAAGAAQQMAKDKKKKKKKDSNISIVEMRFREVKQLAQGTLGCQCLS